MYVLCKEMIQRFAETLVSESTFKYILVYILLIVYCTVFFVMLMFWRSIRGARKGPWLVTTQLLIAWVRVPAFMWEGLQVDTSVVLPIHANFPIFVRVGYSSTSKKLEVAIWPWRCRWDQNPVYSIYIYIYIYIYICYHPLEYFS